MTDAELLDEFEQLIIANATTKAWGAAVSARSERIAGIRTRLKYRLSVDAQQAWQPIETAPKDGTWVLGLETRIGLNTKYVPHEVIRYETWSETWRSSAKKLSEPTHWMPLPEFSALNTTKDEPPGYTQYTKFRP